MLFSSFWNIGKSFYSCLGPHVVLLLDSAMKDFMFLLFVQLFLQLDRKDMKGLERLIMQGMYIADRIAAIFLILPSSLIKDYIIILKAVGTHHTRSICQLALYLPSTQFSMTLLTTAPTIYLSQGYLIFHIEVSLTFLDRTIQSKIIGYLQIVSLKKSFPFENIF